MYGLETGQSGRKHQISHKQFANSMERQLVEGFSFKSVEYNVPLDKFMTYGHIKQFFSDTCNYNGWHDVPDGLKRAYWTRLNAGINILIGILVVLGVTIQTLMTEMTCYSDILFQLHAKRICMLMRLSVVAS